MQKHCSWMRDCLMSSYWKMSALQWLIRNTGLIGNLTHSVESDGVTILFVGMVPSSSSTVSFVSFRLVSSLGSLMPFFLWNSYAAVPCWFWALFQISRAFAVPDCSEGYDTGTERCRCRGAAWDAVGMSREGWEIGLGGTVQHQEGCTRRREGRAGSMFFKNKFIIINTNTFHVYFIHFPVFHLQFFQSNPHKNNLNDVYFKLKFQLYKIKLVWIEI